MPLGAPQERHQTILERFSSHTGIQALSGTPNFAHLGPWERTIIKEIDLKQLKHRIRHASGRWPGEFYVWVRGFFVLAFYFSGEIKCQGRSGGLQDGFEQPPP